MGFYFCKDETTGAAIKDLIIGAVVELGLSMDDCRGQCYDGAGNMSGHLNGASSLLRAEHHRTNALISVPLGKTESIPKG